MKEYEVTAYQKYVGYDKVYIRVRADSPEEALSLVKEDPDNFGAIDSKGVGCDEFEWIDQEDWEVR